MRYVNCIAALCVLFFFIPIIALAGSLNDTGAPDSSTSAMYTLEDIYNRLNAGTTGAKRSGAFTEPSSGPGSTGHTTDDIMGEAPSVDDTDGAGAADVASGKTFWGLKSETGGWGLKTGTGTVATDPAPVAKTGQTPTVPEDPASPGSDGALQKGVAWPSPRFSDNSDGTVTDNLTGLIWLKDANCFGAKNWNDALSDCNGLASGSCGLSDSSTAMDWRLPNVKEIWSLIDFTQTFPALPSAGSYFSNVQNGNYWSSTTDAYNSADKWFVTLSFGRVDVGHYLSNSYYVWPVRGGQ